ncbi:hypothetical protein B5V03_28560 [Bradyrhizobium betae]|uniref:Uncharacterized protein n=1 Tax=Bradyrhizobium betae TaxID=244734 RepID=A0A4Q1USD2_9BRAD|nr:hypothetical protein B5V03_28560 [Bradyrhizobium betae]
MLGSMNWRVVELSGRTLKGCQALFFHLVTIDWPLYWFIDVMKAAMKIAGHTQRKICKFMDARLRFSNGLL